MTVDWPNFLVGLERHVRTGPFVVAGAPAAPVWKPGSGATDSAIAATEARFGVPFPPSYVGFLRTCNGLDLANHPVQQFLPASEVRWFRKNSAAWIRPYAEVQEPGAEREPEDDDYFGYADMVRVAFRPSQFRQAIQVSAVGDAAVYLLNPQVVWPSGEWEAWFLADWNPGILRYRSFAELMWERYGRHTGMTVEQFGLAIEPGFPTVYQDPPGKPGRRVKKLRIPKPPRAIERIARDVGDGDWPTLQRALKELARLATPEAIELLSKVCTHPVDFVRWDAREALNKARQKAAQRGEIR